MAVPTITSVANRMEDLTKTNIKTQRNTQFKQWLFLPSHL